MQGQCRAVSPVAPLKIVDNAGMSGIAIGRFRIGQQGSQEQVMHQWVQTWTSQTERVVITAAAAVTLLTAGASTAQAQVFVCENKDGTPLYTNVGNLGNCKRLDLPHLNTAPALTVPGPKHPTGASAVTNPGARGLTSAQGPTQVAAQSGLRVEASVQKVRDNDRRKILEDELRTEEGKLTELRKEFNNGEPERRGDERNFQKYQDRVQRMKDDIQRSEGNIGALKRELSLLKD